MLIQAASSGGSQCQDFLTRKLHIKWLCCSLKTGALWVKRTPFLDSAVEKYPKFIQTKKHLITTALCKEDNTIPTSALFFITTPSSDEISGGDDCACQ